MGERLCIGEEGARKRCRGSKDQGRATLPGDANDYADTDDPDVGGVMMIVLKSNKNLEGKVTEAKQACLLVCLELRLEPQWFKADKAKYGRKIL